MRCPLPNLLHNPIAKAALVLGSLLATARVAPAQAAEAGGRGAEIKPFAQYSIVSPDWAGAHDFGYTFGVDYTRFTSSFLQPSLEFRTTSATGPTVNEKTYSGGFRLQTTIHGIRPYMTVLGGKGTIYFNHPVYANYLSDTSFVLSLGGGALFYAGHNIDLNIDFSHQNWNIEPQTLTPITMGVGIAYRIPFHTRRTE